MTTKKLTVIYFTVVPLSDASNGGNIACRNHVERLSRDQNIDLHVVAAPLPDNVQSTKSFLDGVGGDHLIIPRWPSNVHQEKMTFRGALSFAMKAATHFPWEFEALNQPQYDEALQWAVLHWNADLIVIDYLYSALFCPRTLAGKTKTAIITLNREEQFYRDMIGLGLIKHDKISAEISARRLAKFEHATYRAVDMVVALSSNDLPSYIPQKKKVSIIPYLDQRERWLFSGSGNVFFVGNIGHYPNREAIATRIAPRIENKLPTLRFKVVGASADQVPPEWRHAQVDYLGVSDADTVKQLFTSSDAMICPINNTYGMKYKIAEAAAHATPLIANSEALQCVPYIKGLPTFRFGDADTAADIVLDVVTSASRAQALSETIFDASRNFIESQTNRWSHVLSNI
jgi:glycosyltransferase involved in cell wall biosynthesis